MCAALVDAVRAQRLDESRLAEAAARVRRVVGWASSAQAGEREDSAVGREAARRALRVVGDASLSGPPLVVELEPEPSMAAGALGADAR